MFKSFKWFLLLVFTNANVLFAATYYVTKTGNDSNAGSQSAPWLTIGKAAGVASAGDTVNIAAGTYSGAVTFSRSGSAGAPITFLGGGVVVVAGNVTFTGNYITLSGITCSPPAAGVYNAVTLNGQNCVLTNCTVANYGAAASDQATAIGLSGASNLVVNCTVRDLKDIDAFHVFGHDQTILGCTVTNLLQVNYALNHTDFIQSWNTGGGAYNILVKNCLCVNSTCQAGNTETDGSATLHDWTFENDVWANVAQPFFCGITRTKFYNCVFYLACNNSGSTTPIVFYQIVNYDSTGSEAVNCVFLKCGPNPGDSTQGGIGANGANLSALRIAQNYIAGSGYAAKSGAYVGASAVNGGNPLFANESGYDFHLVNGGVLVGAGTNLSSVFTTDCGNCSRPTAGAWDIGVYQHGTTNGSGGNINPAILVSPASLDFGTVLTNTSTNLTLTVQNKGGGTLTGTASVAAPFQIASGGTYSLGSNQSQTVTVRFNPTIPGAYNQTITFTGGSGASASLSGLAYVVQPALLFNSGAGTILTPFAVASMSSLTVTGAYSSETINSYISQSSITGLPGSGEAVYGFSIASAGNYIVSAVVNTPNTGANSFYVSIDCQPTDPTMIWDVPVTSGFTNQLVSWRGTGTDTNNQFVPMIFSLSAGTHQLIVRGREAGAQLANINIVPYAVVPPVPTGLRVIGQ